jgi:hypothetical protein
VKLSQCISTAASVISAGATVCLVLVGYFQLKGLRDQIRVHLESEKIRNTLRACERIEIDPELKKCQEYVWNKSACGTDYTMFTEEDKFSVIILMNYFDGIALGILQGIYFDDMVYDNMHISIEKAVKVFLRGESGPGW